MNNIMKNDTYRLVKWKLLYCVLSMAAVVAVILTTIVRQDIRLGISVFGNVIALRGFDDVIRMGIVYHNGLGVLIAVLLSVFIGQEYQWKTWQHKWITNQSRTHIYLSKIILSSAISVVMFLIFQIIVLLGSNQVGYLLTNDYIAMIISGIFIYASLGVVICMLSMLVKNNIASVVISLAYVLFGETIASVVINISNFSESASIVTGWLVRHSIYGMATVVSSALVTWSLVIKIALNSIIIIFLSATIGALCFRRYDL